VPDLAIPPGCFVVVDIPNDVGREILRIRRRFRDPYDTGLPVEITLAGSSGVGVMVPGQSRRQAFGALDAIAATTPPFTASFGPVTRYAGTDIFVLTLRDTTPFDALHRRVASSSIRFTPSPHAYEPHCTLSRRAPIGDEDAAALLATEVPGAFTIDTLAVYRADPLPATVLHRTRLGARTSPRTAMCGVDR
jgi:2'-5' RNA ligase